MPRDDLAAFDRVLGSRRSVKQYDPAHQVTDAELRELFERVTLSPSSFNLQHWRFVVVRDGERKQALQAAAYGQPQVGTCSAAILVCGALDAHEDAEQIYASTPAEVRERMVGTIHGFYAENPAARRDEALRSGALGAMTLMLSARAMGLATGPMIGFDPKAVCELLEVPETWVPVMLVVLGKEQGEQRPRMARRPLADVVRLETAGGAGLA